MATAELRKIAEIRSPDLKLIQVDRASRIL